LKNKNKNKYANKGLTFYPWHLLHRSQTNPLDVVLVVVLVVVLAPAAWEKRKRGEKGNRPQQ
jgi:hypothetical protein